jgi:hypothetical protein
MLDPIDIEAVHRFREYAWKVVGQLESRRFAARLASLPAEQAARVLELVKDLKRAADLRFRFVLQRPIAITWRGVGDPPPRVSLDAGCAEVRRLYLAALEAAGFEALDVPAHSLALRELTRREPGPPFRLLYGVDAERNRALIALGEWLDRSYYGDSVRRAEQSWKEFLSDALAAAQPAQLRQP